MQKNFEDLKRVEQLITIYNGLMRVETKGESSDILTECRKMLQVVINAVDEDKNVNG